MKLERMLSIITYLLSREKVKAQELADKFEVSVRTIYRDIDAISQAGIPIASYQGADGGIGIVEGYKLDRNVLTSDEVLNIVAGLKGLDSISEDIKIKLLIEKLNGVANKTSCAPAGNSIMIDLSSWNKNDLLGLRIQEIKNAIRERKIIEFEYVKGDSLQRELLSDGKSAPSPCTRKVEPYVVVFKEANWYLYAFCLLRQGFRLFKLRRMSGLKITGDSFAPRSFSMDKVGWEEEFDGDRHSVITVLFDRSMEHVVNDIFGIGSYDLEKDGRLKITFHMGIGGWLYGFILGFGDKVEVLEPAELRDTIKSIAESICRLYGNKGG